MNAAIAVLEQGGSQVGLHVGRALLQIAKEYPTILEIIMEQVQNALDANATKIGIILNQKSRRITVTDNGDGVRIEDFEKALGEVCSSQKKTGKLGRFGIGLISPLGKCDSFTFTSCPKGVQQGYCEWTFSTNDIRTQRDAVTIPHQRITTLLFKANAPGTGSERVGAMSAVPWRTKVVIIGYSADRIISRIGSCDTLIENIFERFATTMRKNKVTLSVRFKDEKGQDEIRENVRPVLFTGRKLEPVRYVDETGTTTIELYLARKTTKGYNGKVQLGEMDNDYRCSFTSFANTAQEYLSSEIIDALSKKVFEGEILGSGVTLHSNRRTFERNEAFVGLCVAIEKWYHEFGKRYLDQIKEASEEERYQTLGLQSLATIEEMLKRPEFRDLHKVIHGFKRGTIGDGHIEPDDDGILGTQDEPSLSTDSLDVEGNGKARPKRRPKEENPDHEPFTVIGPQGTRRSIVSNGSLGLQFSHIVMEGSDRLYEVDPRLGVIHFNIRHPIWVACDVSNQKIMLLQEFIAIKVLTWLAMPTEWKDIAETVFDELNGPFAFLIQHSAAFSRGSRPKTSTSESES